MAQSSAPWDGISVGDASAAPYSANEWAAYWNLLHGVGSIFPNYGMLPGTGGGTYEPLQVIPGGAANVIVNIGSALANGKLYTNTAQETLAVQANVSGNPRIDTVILRVDYTAQTTRLIVKQGTPAGSPARVALTQNASTWETPLADVAVANGFSIINTEDILDRRRNAPHSAAGWQWYAYPMNHVPAVTAYTGNVSRTRFFQPISIAGNMLVKELILRSSTTASNRNFKWGVYVQHTNDQGVDDINLYFVGGWINTVAYQVNVTNGQNFIVPAESVFYLPPGNYWLGIENGSGISMPYVGFTTFELGLGSLLDAGAVIAMDQSIDTAAASFSNIDESIPARLEGVKFGGVP